MGVDENENRGIDAAVGDEVDTGNGCDASSEVLVIVLEWQMQSQL